MAEEMLMPEPYAPVDADGVLLGADPESDEPDAGGGGGGAGKVNVQDIS